GVKVVGLPTVRERDGLAMSSRNVYLSTEERETATTLYRVLSEAKTRLRSGGQMKATLTRAEKAIAAAGFELDYFEARHAETLAPVKSMKDGPVRLFVAARIGGTRLIDNLGV